MSKITAGNNLYLYRLLSRELGVGKQTPMARVAEVLEADGIWPEDVGCADARALCEALPDFVKVTAFKKGQVFATVMRNEELDRMLERAGEPTAAEKAASKGKPWKHRKGAKAVKPQKPRHVERHVETEVEPEPEPVAAEPETAAEPKTEQAGAELAQEAVKVIAEVQAAKSEAPEAEPQVEELLAEALSEVLQETAGEKDAEPVTSAATPEDAPERAPKPEPATPVVPAPEPSIKLTITYDPDPEPESDPKATATEQASVTPTPTPAAPAPKAAPKPAPTRPERAHSDLPQNFYADVRCPDEQLSTLYQVLPANVDPMATLEEDFRLARSTRAFEGTRSNITFPLRFQRADGTPVTVTLRRTARAQAGKHWTLAEVSADAPETVGLEGLSVRVEGAWRAFATDEEARAAKSPEDELAGFAVLGSWEKLLSELAQRAEPENWGSELHVLRDYLTMTFHRVQCQHRLGMTDDGSSAAFDTGLLAAETAEPICAVLEPCDGNIIWELTGFSTNTGARAADYPDAPVATELVTALLAANDAQLRRLAQRAARNPRSATVAYDAVADATHVLLPWEDSAAAIDVKGGVAHVVAKVSLADAYACARVISADQPAWLDRGLE